MLLLVNCGKRKKCNSVVRTARWILFRQTTALGGEIKKKKAALVGFMGLKSPLRVM